MLFEVVDATTGEPVGDIGELVLAAQKGQEPWAMGLIYCDMEGWFVGQDGQLLLVDECGNWAYAPEGRFRVCWAHGRER